MKKQELIEQLKTKLDIAETNMEIARGRDKNHFNVCDGMCVAYRAALLLAMELEEMN